MKKQKRFNRRLNLSKETIAQLSDRSKIKAAGASGNTCLHTCTCCDTTIPVPTGQNPCPIPFTESPVSQCC
jgi:hypothetical protein